MTNQYLPQLDSDIDRQIHTLASLRLHETELERQHQKAALTAKNFAEVLTAHRRTIEDAELQLENLVRRRTDIRQRIAMTRTASDGAVCATTPAKPIQILEFKEVA